MALYEVTDGANWDNNTNWLSDAPLGAWYGVTTDTAGRVTKLSLIENNLEGPLPAELGQAGQSPRAVPWGGMAWRASYQRS